MKNQRRAAVIVNPRAANGRTGKQWPRIESQVRQALQEFTPLITEGPGHAEELTRNALREGHERIVSVGGDGTHHEVVNGFFEGDKPVNPDAHMAILPQGTGSDLARTLGITMGAGALEVLGQDHALAADVGRARFALPGGGEKSEYFLNCAHIGMGGEVANRVNRTTKAFGGFASFLWGVVSVFLTHRSKNMRLDIGDATLEQPCQDIIIANGRYDGGGMHVAPQAKLDSGVFEVYIIGDVSRLQGIANMHRLYKGTLKDRTDIVRYIRTERIHAESDEPVLLNLEGEQPGQTPVTIDLLPRALNLACPAQ